MPWQRHQVDTVSNLFALVFLYKTLTWITRNHIHPPLTLLPSNSLFFNKYLQSIWTHNAHVFKVPRGWADSRQDKVSQCAAASWDKRQRRPTDDEPHCGVIMSTPLTKSAFYNYTLQSPDYENWRWKHLRSHHIQVNKDAAAAETTHGEVQNVCNTTPSVTCSSVSDTASTYSAQLLHPTSHAWLLHYCVCARAPYVRTLASMQPTSHKMKPNYRRHDNHRLTGNGLHGNGLTSSHRQSDGRWRLRTEGDDYRPSLDQ